MPGASAETPTGNSSKPLETSLERRCLAEGRERLLSEWHPDKNLPLTPDRISSGSKKVVWWKCSECGHEWQTQVKYRFGYGKHKPTGCPECAKRPKRTLREWCVENDRADVLAEFDCERNTETPDSLSAHSSKAVWWSHYDAESGMEHPWKAMVGSRTKEQGAGCPYCAGVATLAGYNDLATRHQELMPYWDRGANDVDPATIPTTYAEKVSWRCPDCGHGWRAKAAQILSKQPLRPICPACREEERAKRILELSCPAPKAGVDDLATTHPDIAEWWHPVKNNGLEPGDVTASDARVVWWCAFSTVIGRWVEWQEPVRSCSIRLTAAEGKCPYIRLEQGVSDLATTHPLLATEWSERNDVPASAVRVRDDYSGWWECSCCGHEWHMTTTARGRGRFCPECSERVSAGAGQLYERAISQLDAVPVPTPLGPGVRCRSAYNPYDSQTSSPEKPEVTLVVATLFDCWDKLLEALPSGGGWIIVVEAVEASAPLIREGTGLGDAAGLEVVLDSVRASGGRVLGGFLTEGDAEQVYSDVIDALCGSGSSSSGPTITAPSLSLPSMSE